MTVSEKVSYLKGLAEGLDFDKNSKEGKILSAIIDVLDDMAYTIEDLDEGYTELSEYCEDIDKDLGDLEEYIYGDDEEEDEEDDDLYTYKCPNCGEEVFLDDEDFNDEDLKCPYCNTEMELELGCGCDDEECECK